MPGPTPQHQLVKADALAKLSVGMLEQDLVIPNLFQKESIDQFRGEEDDTLSVKVEGVLPFHEYAWRNDRSQGIVFDVYRERKIAVTFGGNVYSAVKLTDEQYDFDLDNWGQLLRPQVKAVARGLGRRAVNVLNDQDYAVTIGNAEQNLRAAIIEARRVLNAFHASDSNRYLLVGTDFESALLNDDKLNLAQNVGDNVAQAALENATIGRRFGFTIIVDSSIPSDAAYAFAGNGFIFLSGAPYVPQSVPYGATTSFEGISLRWIRDYDSEYMQDRSVVNTYAGFRSVPDILVGWDEANNTEVVSAGEHFVRGIKLTLDGSSDYPSEAAGPAGELSRMTGIKESAAFTPTGPAAETDPANA